MNRIMSMIGKALVPAILLLAPAAAQQAPQAEPVSAVQNFVTAPVTLDGRELFRVRGVSAYPAEQRAGAVEDKIAAVAADRKIPVESLTLVELEDRTNIVAGEVLITGVLDVDAEPENVPRQILAQVYKLRISEAIKDYRQERSRSSLISKAALSAGLVVALAVLLFMIVRVFRRLDAAIEARYKTKIQGVRIQAFQLVQAEQLWTAVRGIPYMLRSLLILALVLGCLEYILSLFPWTRYVSYRAFKLVLDPLRIMAASILGSVPNFIFIAILVLIIRYILKLARLFFAGVQSGNVSIAGFDRDWALPTYKIFRLVILAFAAVVAYPYIPGAESDAFKGVSLFAGVIFSIGSTSMISNTVAGYALIYRRVFKIGEFVRIGDAWGTVEQIRLQVTHLRTIKNEEVILPNSTILNSYVINYSTMSQTAGLILHTTVGIGYETPWRQVESMLLMAAGRTEGLLREPAPFVRQKALGDFCVTYEINAYCGKPPVESFRLYTELHRNILDVFNEYGVQIMTPAYEGDPVEPKVVPREKWYEQPAASPERAGRHAEIPDGA